MFTNTIGKVDITMSTYALAQMTRATLSYTLGGGLLAQNVFHLGEVSAPVTQADCDDIAAEFDVFVNTNGAALGLKEHLSNTCTFTSVVVRTLDPGNPLETQLALGDAGTVAQEPVPLESAVVTTFYSTLASRRGRGRTFLGGVAHTAVVDGILSLTARTAIELTYETARARVEATGVREWAVWSPTNNSGKGIESVLTRETLHHQRRRNQ